MAPYHAESCEIVREGVHEKRSTTLVKGFTTTVFSPATPGSAPDGSALSARSAAPKHIANVDMEKNKGEEGSKKARLFQFTQPLSCLNFTTHDMKKIRGEAEVREVFIKENRWSR